MGKASDLEAEAREIYPVAQPDNPQHLAVILGQRAAHVLAKTVSDEQLEMAAEAMWVNEHWVLASVTDWASWAEVNDERAKRFRSNAEVAARALGLRHAP